MVTPSCGRVPYRDGPTCKLLKRHGGKHDWETTDPTKEAEERLWEMANFVEGPPAFNAMPVDRFDAEALRLVLTALTEERRKREEAEAERWADFNCHLEGTDNEWLIEACNLAPDQHVSLGVMRIIIEAGEWKKRAERAEREARVLRGALRDIIYASDRCLGHRGCSHSMEPWKRARAFIAEAHAAEEGEE